MFLIFKRFRGTKLDLWITLLTDAAKYRCFFDAASFDGSPDRRKKRKTSYKSYG